MTSISMRIDGTAGRDAEIRYTQAAKPVASVSVAHTPRRLNEQTQQWEDAGETTWVRLNFWDKQAEAALHIKKGMRIVAEGTPRVSAYTGQGGEARASLDLRVYSWGITPKAQNNQQAPARPQQEPQAADTIDPWGNPATGPAPF